MIKYNSLLLVLLLFVLFLTCCSFEDSLLSSVDIDPEVTTKLVGNGYEVSITKKVKTSSIYYTVDGTTPNKASFEYAGPFRIDFGTTLKVIAILDGRTSSVITKTMPTPVSEAPSIEFDESTWTATISCSNPTASIYYSISNSSSGGSFVEYDGPVYVPAGKYITAYAVEPYYSKSAKVVKAHVASSSAKTSKPEVSKTIIASNDDIAYIWLSCSGSGDVIYYTTDGTDPSKKSGIKYSGPFRTKRGITIKAIAVPKESEMKNPSEIMTYVISPYTY